jgi:hypothetical protein
MAQANYSSLQSSYSSLQSQNSDLQKERDEQKCINRELVSMLNNLSLQMLDENFISSSYFTESDLPNCRQKLIRIINETRAKNEEQSALIIRNSTDFTVTKETLRLTQVANLSLQKQVSDNQIVYQRELTDKDKQIKEKNDQIKQGMDLYKKKEEEVRDLNNQNTELKDKHTGLREENSVTKIKLEKKEEEIDELKIKLGQSEEEFLESKIRLKQEKLELFANRLEINLEQIQNIREQYEEIVRSRRSRVNNTQAAERNITRIKQELRKKIQMEDIQEVCARCEEVAELRVKLDKLREQQFQAHQEVPPHI